MCFAPSKLSSSIQAVLANKCFFLALIPAMLLAPPVWSEKPPTNTVLMAAAKNTDNGVNNSFLYYAFSNQEVVFKPGDTLEYDIYLDKSNPTPRGGIDADLADGPALREKMLLDQHGLRLHGDQELLSAIGRWYHRKFSLNSVAGQRAIRWNIVFEGDKPGQYIQFVDDVRVNHADGTRTILYGDGDPAVRERRQTAGYNQYAALAPLPRSMVTHGKRLAAWVASTVDKQYREQLEKEIASKNGEVDSLHRDLKAQKEQTVDLEEQMDDLKQDLFQVHLHPASVLKTGTILPSEYDLSGWVHLGAGNVRFRFNIQPGGSGYQLTVKPGGLALYRSVGSSLYPLAWSSFSPAASPARITLQMRHGKIAVLAGSRLVLSAYDNNLTGGTAEVLPIGGAACSHTLVQPVESPAFSDDFTRLASGPGDWTYLLGRWQIATVGTVLWGANPFWLESNSNPVGLASAGCSFWSDYHVETAARGSADTTLGLCAGLQDDHNYYLLRWTTGPAGALTLVRVVNGQENVLARRQGGFLPDVWYQLGLQVSAGLLVVEVDHQPVLSIQDGTFGQGKIGLYSQASKDQSVSFDNVRVSPARRIYHVFGDTQHPFSPRWETQDDKALVGDPTWQDYTLTARVVGSRLPMGLPFHYHDPLHYYIFTWDASHSSLAAVEGNRRRVLAESNRGVPSGKTAAVQVGADNGYLWAAIDGRRVAEALDFALPAGRAGFQPVSAVGREVHSLALAAVDDPEDTDGLTREFTRVGHHKEMRGWSGPLNAWEAADFGSDKGYWHKGNLYGDTTIQIPLTPSDLKGSRFALLLNSDGKSATSGYQLEYSAASEVIHLSLLRQQVEVASAVWETRAADREGVSLELCRRGSYLYARIGGEPVLQYKDSSPVDGYSTLQPVDYGANLGGHSRLGLIVRGTAEPDMAHILVTNPRAYAETFHSAAENWRPQGGSWANQSRWSCTPGWTWYGGKSTGYAVNWYKTPLWGDQSIDSYTAIMMSAVPDSSKQENQEAWRDLNFAFCSDGVNLMSGYTLVVSGPDGGKSRLLRKGQVVAESTSFAFPVERIAHRLWFNTSVVRQAGAIHITLSYFGEDAQLHTFPLIDWTDPDPLPGGFAGFWTYDNGMMIAKVMISSQQQGTRPFYAAEKSWLAEHPDSYPPIPGSTPDPHLAALPPNPTPTPILNPTPTLNPIPTPNPIPTSSQPVGNASRAREQRGSKKTARSYKAQD